MSKASDLRRKATEAVRAKDFDRAVELYEKVCSQDPSNGTPRNELGDVFLKLGDTERAIASFTEAGRLYAEFGLHNNAVAVHKKILRHEPNHLHSLWVLGELRRDQGLEAQASAAFLEFLNRYESVTESEREAFVARGLQLIELMGDDPQILSSLDSIFAHWDFGQERARVLVAKARLAHLEDEHEVRDKYIEHARVAFQHLDALPDYVDFQNLLEPGSAKMPIVDADGNPVVDDEGNVTYPDEDTSDTIVLDDDETSFDFSDDDAPVFDAAPSAGFDSSGPATTRVTLDETDIDLGFDFDMDALDDVAGPESKPGMPTGVADSMAVDPVPEVSIDDEDDFEPNAEPNVELAPDPIPESEPQAAAPSGSWGDVDFSSTDGAESDQPGAEAPDSADLDSEAAEEPVSQEHAIEEPVSEEPVSEEPADVPSEDPVEATADSAPATPDAEPQETVDLLAQILSDDSFDIRQAEKSQVDTIANEMQGVIGSDVDPSDHAGQYEVGMVYMDMALYEQAIQSFDLASHGDDERLRALEMKGTCLLRLERVDDALAVFQEGLAVPGYPGRSYLGLLYGVGAGHEARGDIVPALEYFERVHAVDAAFLDVDERLTRLRASVGDA